MTILDAKKANNLNGGASFSRANRVYRACWLVCWTLLAAWTPRPFMPWRRFLLRTFGARIASSAMVYGSVKIWSPANLVMGKSSCIGPRVTVYSMATITLEAYALVSQGAHLCAGTHDIEDPCFQLVARPIVIQERAWVAAEAFVGPGVLVGQGAVLGARGCAFRALAPWTVYAGNPAQVLRPRNMRMDESASDMAKQ